VSTITAEWVAIDALGGHHDESWRRGLIDVAILFQLASIAVSAFPVVYARVRRSGTDQAPKESAGEGLPEEKAPQ
jgi:hypothetical protein